MNERMDRTVVQANKQSKLRFQIKYKYIFILWKYIRSVWMINRFACAWNWFAVALQNGQFITLSIFGGAQKRN